MVRTPPSTQMRAWALAALATLVFATSCFAQFGGARQVVQPATDPKAAEAAAAAAAAAQAGQPAAQPGQPGQPQGQPGQPAQPGQPGGEAKPPEGVKRPLEPPVPPNPSELDVRPDEEGKLSFSFKGQPWPAVLEWLADVSDMNLHWDEAPPGYLDLTTRGRYTVAEVRDLINSVLLSKGYTLLRNGEILVVANVKSLDPSLVPRVDEEDLQKRSDYELVKSFFDLDWLVADAAAEEIKPLLSSYGKVTPLKNTNRLDVMDTAGNLRRIRDLLNEEQSEQGQESLMKTFALEHTRAEDVEEMLNTLLGLDSKNKSSGPMSPEQQMMAQQQAMQMAQMQAQQQAQGGAAAGPKKEAPINLAVNQRENSIMAIAPPDKMAIIEQAIKAIDVPQDASKSLLTNLQRIRPYRLSGITPDALVRILEDLGGLDPATRLEVDAKNKAIIAYAPLADHLLIESLVQKLDGTGRTFEVIQLRRLSAEYVAGSIAMLMSGSDEDENQSSRNRYRYYFYDPFNSGGDDDKKSDKFQVEADIEHNRLLLRANEVELAEINDLLVKLGEIPPGGRNMNTMRVIPATPGDETQQLIDQLQRLWPTVSENPLEVEINQHPRARGRQPADKQPDGARRDEQPADQQPDQQPADDDELDGNVLEPARDARSPAGAGKPARRAAAARRVKQAVHSSGALKSAWLLAAAGQAAGAADADAGPAADADQADPDAALPAGDPAQAAGDEELPDAEEAAADQESGDRARRMLEEYRRQRGGQEAAEFQEPQPPAPVKITVGPNGLVVSSTDTEALDRMEDLIANIMPSRQSFKIFTLKHTYAKDVAYLLKDIFKEDDSSRDDMLQSYFWGYSPDEEEQTSSLSRRRPLKFVSDSLTNTILVQGADADQLAEIEYLIELYDRVEAPDSNSVRRTQRIALHYAEADQAAEVIKDVFRDLLSPNDKALMGGQPQQPQQEERGGYRSILSYLTEDADDAANIPRFKGMLSVGIDKRGNALVISAPQVLLADVIEMVEQIDQGARSTRAVVRVTRLRQPGTAAQIQQAFGIPGSSPASGSPPAPPGTPAGPKGPDQQPMPAGNGAATAVPGG